MGKELRTLGARSAMPEDGCNRENSHPSMGHLHNPLHLSVCTHTNMHVCIYICVYIYTYICICIFREREIAHVYFCKQDYDSICAPWVVGRSLPLPTSWSNEESAL